MQTLHLGQVPRPQTSRLHSHLLSSHALQLLGAPQEPGAEAVPFVSEWAWPRRACIWPVDPGAWAQPPP